jgi:hypothetical protein
MEAIMNSGFSRIVVLTVFLLSANSAVTASGNADGDEPVEVTWFNYSDYTVVSAKECKVAQRIEKELNVKLTLKGGRRGSPEVSDQLYRAMLRGQEMPDVYPWHHTLISSYPPINELYTPITIEQIRSLMPNTYKALEDASIRSFGSRDEIWTDVMVDGTIYAIPRLSIDYSFSPGILWRKDILDELGLPVPVTVEEWERTFEAYKRRYPDRTCWGGIDGHGYVFDRIFAATGNYNGGFARSGDDIAPELFQPEIRNVLETLMRWYERGYIRVFPQNDGNNNFVPDSNRYFIKGDIIVSDNARARLGDLICDEPFYPHSLPDLTRRQIPQATFVPGPNPIYEMATGGSRSYSSGEPHVSGFFGFDRRLIDEPERLERIMTMIDALAGDERAYLNSQYGEEGVDWNWESLGGTQMPVRSNPQDRSSNIGAYWLQSYSPYQRTYGMDPRIQQNIYDLYLCQGAIYGSNGQEGAGDSSADNTGVRYRIPYSDVREEATNQKSTYQEIHQRLHVLFYRQYYLPMLKGLLPLEAFDEFQIRYFEEGGSTLIEIIKAWSLPQ